MEWMIIGEFQELSENYKPIKDDLKEDEAFRLKMFKPGYHTIATKKLISSSTKNANSMNTEESSTQRYESFELNVVLDSKPWLYPIDNGKKTRNRQHCYVLSIYKPTSQQRQLELVGRFHSSSFLLSPTSISEKSNSTSSRDIPVSYYYSSSDEEDNDESYNKTQKLKRSVPEKKQRRKNHSQLAQKKSEAESQQQEEETQRVELSSASNSEYEELDRTEELVLHHVSPQWSSVVIVRIPSSSPSTTSEEEFKMSDQRRRTATTLQYLLSSSAGVSSPVRNIRNSDDTDKSFKKRRRDDDHDDCAVSREKKQPTKNQKEEKKLLERKAGSRKDSNHRSSQNQSYEGETSFGLDWFDARDEAESNDLPIFCSFPSFDINDITADSNRKTVSYSPPYGFSSVSLSLFRLCGEESSFVGAKLLQSPRKSIMNKEQELLLSITPPQRKYLSIEQENEMKTDINNILSPSKLSFDDN
jgi:hypothetical protein